MQSRLLSISILTMTGLFGILTAFLILLFYFLDVPILYALIGSIIGLILQFLIGPWLTDLNMRWIYKAKFDGDQIPDYMKRFIEEVCAQNNMKLPKVGYIDDGAPNAFTYGRTKNDARIILTRGIFEMLDEDEAKAVVGHELGHAVHHDILIMTIAQLVPMVLYAVYQAANSYKSSDSSSSDSNKGEAAVKLIGLVAYILYIISQYIILWLSRTREYMADAFSAEVTKNPNALASALVEIGFGLSTKTEKRKQGSAMANPTTLGISDKPSSMAMAVSSYSDGAFSKQSIKNAMKWDLWNPWATVYELQSTHPLISKRIRALSSLSAEYGQEPYIVFDLVKPESYMDDFLKEVLINFLPAILLIAGLIVFALTNPGRNFRFAGLVLLAPLAASLFKYGYTHPKKEFAKANVRGLLAEVKVSGITSVPCELTGTIIGRGNPGCVFNEDFVLRDESGIMFLDYEQPLFLINKIFALFKSPEYFDKVVTARGYYRRAPVPFVQLKELVIDGQVKKCHSITWGWIWRWILFGLAAVATVLFFMM